MDTRQGIPGIRIPRVLPARRGWCHHRKRIQPRNAARACHGVNPMRRHPTAHALLAAFVMPWRAHRGMFVGQLLVMVAAGLAPVLAAWLLRAVLNSLTGGGPATELPYVVVALAATVGVQELLSPIGKYLGVQSGRAIERLATTELFGAVCS